MTFRLPEALKSENDEAALNYLDRYFGRNGEAFLGAEFDTWGKPDGRDPEPNRFTSEDLIALSFLSVPVGGLAARQLLRDRSEELEMLLHELGPDRDLAEIGEPLADDWVGWRLMSALRGIDQIGPTRASKLLARKRPRLRPIYDTVVAAVTGTSEQQWEPVRKALCSDGGALQHRLVLLHQAADLPEAVPYLRVLDVVAWMEGKEQGL